MQHAKGLLAQEHEPPSATCALLALRFLAVPTSSPSLVGQGIQEASEWLLHAIGSSPTSKLHAPFHPYSPCLPVPVCRSVRWRPR